MAAKSTPTKVQVGHMLVGSSPYSVLKFLGEGAFGEVAKCKNLITKETVAVKIIKDTHNVEEVTKHEVSILKMMSALDPDRINVVRFIEQFTDMERNCLVFEMLDMNLFDMIEADGNKPLCLHEIRPIAKQLLVALDALKSLGIVHSDLKPDNIMVVSKHELPFRVKLIDFGLAVHVSKDTFGWKRQPIGYRAPEVSLGLPFNEAIDTWGMGCILAFLYLAEHLFHVGCEYQMMRGIVALFGQPRDHLLERGIYSGCYFQQDEPSHMSKNQTWRLLTPEEYSSLYKYQEERNNSPEYMSRSLDGLLHFHPRTDASEYADRLAFINLLERLLRIEADKRISPGEALLEPFFTLSHLTNHVSYMMTADTIMDLGNSEDLMNPLENFQGHGEAIIYHTGDNDLILESFGTVTSEDTPTAVEGIYSDEEDSDPALPLPDVLRLQSFDDDPAQTSDAKHLLPSRKNGVIFNNDLTLESVDMSLYSFEKSSRPADRAFSARTYIVQTDDDCHLSSFSSEDLPSLSSDEDSGSDSSHDEPSTTETTSSYYSRATVACSPEGSTEATPRRRKILKRIGKFFRRVAQTLCCCCRVED